MHKTCVFALAFLLLAMPPAVHSAVTNLVVDIPTRGVLVRILYNAPDAPIAHLILLQGIYGDVGIQPDGRMLNAPPDAQARIAAWVAAGVAFTVVDTPFASPIDPAFRRSAAHVADLQAVIRNLQQQAPVPVWLMGLGSGAISAASVASRLFPDVLVGVVLGNPHTVGEGTLNGSDVASIHGPTLVINHADDPCPISPPANVPALFAQLVNASATKHVALTGGNSPTSDPCGDLVGPHAWGGLFTVVVDTVVGWIRETNGLLDVAKAPAIAVAVEFYHRVLDHYFITDRAPEIADLDNGVHTGWTRTKLSFNVFTAPGPGTSPVCRFRIPPEDGDSHFYGRGTKECDDTAVKFPTFFNEDSQFFHVILPVLGVCPPGTINVYRVFSDRPGDANHRYTIDPAVRDLMHSMQPRPWTIEGDGDNFVVMCVPPTASVASAPIAPPAAPPAPQPR